MFRAWLLALVVLLGPSLARAQSAATPAELRKVTDTVMEQVGKGNIDAALQLLKPRIVIPEAEFDAMSGQAKLLLPAITQRFGKTIGYEFLREDRAGENLIRYSYIQRFEKHAMRWIFYCYRGNDGWIVNTFRFDDKLHEIFQ